MNLRRYIPVKDDVEDAGLRMVRFDDGAWVRAADVDALLARIRAAVEAERAASAEPSGHSLASAIERQTLRDATRATLDALLSPGECSSLCAPGSGERCMVSDSGRCPEGVA